MSFYSAEASNLMVVGGGVPVAGGDGPNAWYGVTYSVATGNLNNTTAQVQSVSVTTGGSATKLRAYVTEQQATPMYIKIAIYNDAGTTLLGSCTTAAITDNQYNECTLGTPVAVTTGTRYRLGYLSSDSFSGGKGSGNTAYGFYQGSLTYAAFPPATLSTTDVADEDWCVGVYVD